jgi:phosphate acetyltransferase
VVHGGDRFTSSVRVDDTVIAAVRSLSHLAPLHNPANLAGIEAVRDLLPDLPQVVVFDTAFHQTMPPHAYRYAVPEEWYTRYGVRRYGFHGISHRFVSEQAAAMLGRPLGELRLVTAHLGNGCSATAVRDGVSVDTTMGLTPLDGLVMGTRSGDVDPGLLSYLAGRTGMNVDELTRALNVDLDPGLPIDDLERIEAVTDAIAHALDASWLESLPSSAQPRRLSPAAFRYQLVGQASAAGACLVLPEGTEPRIVQAAIACAERGIARSVLLGPPYQVTELARSLGLHLPDGVTVVDPQAVAERYVAPLAALRKHRGWTEEMARHHLADPITVGTMMLQQGEVDGLVAGVAHTTAATVRPALQILGTRPGSRLVSSVFFMCLPDEVVVYGDCAINPQPSAEDLADIAIQSAASARAFGIEPRVTMISYSTGTSGSGVDVDKVAEATRVVRGLEPGLAVDGPLQYDAAAIVSVGQTKRPGSAVAGRANVFIFPDLNTGNTTYKAVQRSAQVVSVGPMLQGLAKPVNDLSRGALVDDIVYTVALTAIQSRA